MGKKIAKKSKKSASRIKSTQAKATKSNAAKITQQASVPGSATIPVTCKFPCVSDTMVKFDHATAEKFAKLPELEVDGFKLDRKLNWNVAKMYANKMTIGTFLWQRVTLVTVIYNDVEMRINGQHSVHGRILCADKNTSPLVRWVRYKAESEDDLRELYCHVDDCTPRSNTDKLRAMLVGTAEFKYTPLVTLSLLSCGMSLWLNPTRMNTALSKSMLTVVTRANFMLGKHYDATRRILNILGPDRYRCTWTAPVVAAMYTVFTDPKYATDKRAINFWTKVVRNDGLKPGTAEWLLFTYLSEHNLKSDNSKAANQVHKETMLRVCLGYFKAWTEGGPLENINSGSYTLGRPVL